MFFCVVFVPLVPIALYALLCAPFAVLFVLFCLQRFGARGDVRVLFYGESEQSAGADNKDICNAAADGSVSVYDGACLLSCVFLQVLPLPSARDHWLLLLRPQSLSALPQL